MIKDERRMWCCIVRSASLFALTLMIALSSAKAQEASDLSPHTPVASDGSVLRSPAAARMTRGENGFRGRGLPIEHDPIESAAEFEALVALPEMTPENDGAETVIGPDDRTQVSPTTGYPARAVVLITFDDGRCTGWLYGPNIVATAGHCVHSGGSSGSWKTNVVVYPGRNGTLSPYGSCTAQRLHSVTGWTTSGDERFDYGAIKLNCSIGSTTGWFGYWWQSASLTGLPTVISGYPGDKPFEQWKSSDQGRVTEASKIFYLNDTEGGMSGSPVYYNRPAGSSSCAGSCSMGIHTNGLHGDSPHNDYNHGTRIVEPVFNNLQAWKSAS